MARRAVTDIRPRTAKPAATAPQRARPNQHRGDDRPARHGEARKDARPHGDRDNAHRGEYAHAPLTVPTRPLEPMAARSAIAKGSPDLSKVGFLARAGRPSGERRDHHERTEHGRRPDQRRDEPARQWPPTSQAARRIASGCTSFP